MLIITSLLIVHCVFYRIYKLLTTSMSTSDGYGAKLVFWNEVRQIPELFGLLCLFCATLENINTDSCESMAFCGSCRSRLNLSGHQLVKCKTCTNPVYIGPFNRAKYCKKCASVPKTK